MHQTLLSEATMTVGNRQILDLDGPSEMVIGRLTMIRQAIISGATACCRRFLDALQESRRKQAAIERARYRHLIYDADTGIHFGAYRPAGESPFRL